MQDKRPYKRKLLNLSVNRKIQFRMIFGISSILFVCLFISSAVYFQLANQEIESSFKMFHIKARNFLDLLLPVVGLSFVVSLGCGVLASLFFPKSYAGALYRIEADLKKVVDTADLTVQIKLRDGDQATLLAAQTNALLEDFRGRIAHAQTELEKLDALCQPGAVIHQQDLKGIHQQLHTQIGNIKI